MKNIIIILILFPTLAFGQLKLQGKYCSSHAFTGSCFTFIDDSTFTYIGATCLTKSKGQGKYKIYDNFIEFSFISTDSIVENTSFISDTTCDSKDSVIFYFYIQDGDDEPMSFTEIKFRNTFNIDTNLVADSLGKAEILLKKSTDTVNTIISFIGYELHFIKLIPSNCVNITVNLTEYSSWDVRGGVKRKYKIIEMSREKLILMDDNENQEIYVKSE